MLRHILIAALLCASCANAGSTARLFFGADGSFKIVQLTDMHIITEEDDKPTLDLSRKVLAAEKPDFVALTGDILTGSDLSRDEAGKQRGRAEYKKVMSLLDEGGFKWGYTVGNHDPDGPLTPEDLVDNDMTGNGSLTQRGPSELQGAANYYIPVYATEKPVAGEVPALLLWFLAVNHEWSCEGVSGQGCISRPQVAWFANVSDSLAAKYGLARAPPSLMFIHIAPAEMVTMWDYQTCHGMSNEDTSCPQVNTGIYDAAYKHNTRGIFFGHDHKNEYCGADKSKPELTLCFGRKTGWHYYNPDFAHGARVINVALKGSDIAWDTWIREDSKKVVQQPHEPSSKKQGKCA